MPAKPWWTVFAVYEDTEEPYVAYVQADDKKEARSRALQNADGVVLVAGIALGKITDASVDGMDNIVPIRGKTHAIEVTHVHVTRRKIVVPARCPGCRADLRKTAMIVETLLDTRQRVAHLSPNGKDIVDERSQGSRASAATSHGLVDLACASCGHEIWKGLHVD